MGATDLTNLSVECPQCGSDRVDVLGRTRAGVRLSCRACRAVVRRRDLAALERPAPSSALAPSPAGGLAPLAPYVAPVLLAWLRARPGPGRGARTAAAGTDKASIYRVWKEFDRFLAAARQEPGPGVRYAELAAQAGTPAEPPATPLPSFGEVAGQLQNHSYDESAVVATLGRSLDDAWMRALRDRVACARRWLAGPGRAHCWIAAPAPTAAEPGAVAPQAGTETRAGARAGAASEHEPDGHAVVARRLLELGGLDRRLDPEERQALFAAVFGTPGGPPTAALVAVFGASRLQAALAVHLRDGSHPLRPAVLDALGCGRLPPGPP